MHEGKDENFILTKGGKLLANTGGNLAMVRSIFFLSEFHQMDFQFVIEEKLGANAKGNKDAAYRNS